VPASPSNLRALMLSDVYFPRVNGVSTSIQTFRADLAALGCSTLLVAPRYEQTWLDDSGTRRVVSRRVPFDPEDRLMRRRALYAACRALEGQFDLIHIQTPFLAHSVGIRLARELGVKVVETYHTYFEEYFHHYVPMLPRAALRVFARAVSRSQCNAVDVIIAPSTPMAEVLRDYGARARIEVIATGLDMEVFERGNGDRFRAAHGIEPDRPVVLHVGRVAFEKNIGFIVDVFGDVVAQVPDALLIIAGEGPALPALRRHVRDRGLAECVRFVGYLDRSSELLDCYRSADVFAFASNTETQGLVLLEAMAVGTPVVSTAVLGTKEILARGCPGAIVAREHRAEFARAVVTVLTERSLRAQLSAGGKAFVRDKWSSRQMAGRLLDVYRELCAR
jgi:1,2-diacylglycerol 3-alpha-glucosyltransferase